MGPPKSLQTPHPFFIWVPLLGPPLDFFGLVYYVGLMDAEPELLTPFIERVPITPLPPLSERERVHVAAVTAIAEFQLGAPLEITEEDEVLARQMVQDGRMPTRHELTKPGLVVKLEALLAEYDYKIIDDAIKLRTYVTNRLIEESDDKDPKIRMRALEMLGKITDVGLFTERKEVVITNKTDADLEKDLRESLTILLNPEDYTEDVNEVVVEAVPVRMSDVSDALDELLD